MKESARRLSRLLTIRKLSEELDCRALGQALAAVAEVDAALVRQQQALDEAGCGARAALSLGDRCGWLLAEAQGEVAGWNRGRLREILRLRREAVAPAMDQFLKSRREKEQVSHLVEDARAAARDEEDRREQAAADDWFLDRRDRGAE